MVILISNFGIAVSFRMNSNTVIWFSRAAFHLIKIPVKSHTRKLPLNPSHLSRHSTSSLASISLFPTPFPQPSTKAGERQQHCRAARGHVSICQRFHAQVKPHGKAQRAHQVKPHRKAQRAHLQPDPTAWYATGYRNCTGLCMPSQQKARRLLLLAVM